MFKHPFLKASNYNYTDNIIVYNINTKGEGLVWLKRNSGPFWEPGAFAGFLVLALLFNIIRKGRLNNKTNMILIFGVMSTFSTSGYVALVFVVLSYLMAQRNRIRRIVYVPLIIFTSAVLFFSVDFIGEKIQRKLSFTNQTYNTRFKSAKLDLEDFMDHPFVGLGRSEKTRFKGERKERSIHRNNLFRFSNRSIV